MILLERQKDSLSKRRTIFTEIDSILGEDWETLEEIKDTYQKKNKISLFDEKMKLVEAELEKMKSLQID